MRGIGWLLLGAAILYAIGMSIGEHSPDPAEAAAESFLQLIVLLALSGGGLYFIRKGRKEATERRSGDSMKEPKGRSPCPQDGRVHLEQRPTRGWTLISVGAIFVVFGFAFIVAVQPLGENEADATAYFLKLPPLFQMYIMMFPDGTPILLLAFPGAFIATAGIYLARHGRRHIVAIHNAGDTHNIAHTILYLRPFAADKAIIWGQPWFALGIANKRLRTWMVLSMRGISRYEELLSHAFGRVGTLVTIGSPKENLPLLGGERVYAAGETWKGEVQRLAANAELILLHVGSTQGVRWEIEHIVTTCDPLRTLFCVNPVGKLTFLERLFRPLRRKRLRKTWTEFREACSAVFPNGLPAAVGDALFIRFDKSWNAVPLQPQGRKVVWFWPGKNLDLSRKTIDSALLWLSWLLTPEPTTREFVREVINIATLFACFACVIGVMAGVIELAR